MRIQILILGCSKWIGMLETNNMNFKGFSKCGKRTAFSFSVMISIRSLICYKKSVNRITRFFWHSFVVEYRDVLRQSPHLASLRIFIQWSPLVWNTTARALIGWFFSLVSCTRLSTRKSRWQPSWWWIQKWLDCFFLCLFLMANTSQVWTLNTWPLTKIWKNDYHNCITQRWKIVVSNVISWHRLRCTIVEKTLDAEKYRCKENR